MEKTFLKPEDVQVEFPNVLSPSVISHAVKVSGSATVIYISGQVSTDEKGDVVAPDDLVLQTHQVFANLKRVLTLADATLQDIVALNVYMTDIGEINTFRTLRLEYLDNAKPPAITTVGVTGLAGPGLVIEIGAVAVVDG